MGSRLAVRYQYGPGVRVSVIIAAYQASATLERTLSALAHQDLSEPYEVIVVDDGSDDGTAEIAEQSPRTTVLRQERQGAAAARNLGASAAAGEVLAFTDADCEPLPTWLSAGLRALENADLVQGSVGPPPGEYTRPFDRTVWVVEESGLYETANLFTTRVLFRRIGGFQACLDHHGGRPMGEDTWFGWRARRAGARTAFSTEAPVHHAVFRGTARDFITERRRYRYFPALAARIPELRGHLFYARFFLNSRTAAFDASLVGLGSAVALESVYPLAAAAPYAYVSIRRAWRWRKRAPVALTAGVAADAVALASLLEGSVRHRTPVL